MYPFKFLKSILKSALRGIGNDPEIKKISHKFPKTTDFLKDRFTPDEKFGLHLTIGLIISSIFAYLFVSLLYGFFTQDVFVLSDLRILNIIKTLREESLTQVMLFVTTLGDKLVIFSGIFLVSLFFILIKRWRYLVTILASTFFGEIFIWAMKHLVERKRPPLSVALIQEDGFSFPSGHAFMAMAFYGLIGYFVFRRVRSKTFKVLVVLLFAFLIIIISFSRLYLGVHWPSDVLASLTAGLAWISVFITALEIRRQFKSLTKEKIGWRVSQVKIIGLSLLALWILSAIFSWQYLLKRDYRSLPSQKQSLSINLPRENFSQKLFLGLPRVSETISGKAQEPINVIFLGSKEQLQKAFTEAHWLECDRIRASSLKKMTVALIFKTPYPTAPGIPSLWNTMPNDLAFQKPTPNNSIRERNHVHFWKTPFLIDGKESIWFGTAHFDQTIKESPLFFLPTHTIDPAIDREREKIKEDLLSAKDVNFLEELQVLEPTLGKNQVGDPFFTDGKAVILEAR